MSTDCDRSCIGLRNVSSQETQRLDYSNPDQIHDNPHILRLETLTSSHETRDETANIHKLDIEIATETPLQWPILTHTEHTGDIDEEEILILKRLT